MKIAMTLMGLSIVFLGMIVLQIFLSQKENKRLGRILPMMTFSFSIIMTLIVLFSFINVLDFWPIIAYIILSFLVWNVPTMILYVIYKVCREKVVIKNLQRGLGDVRK